MLNSFESIYFIKHTVKTEIVSQFRITALYFQIYFLSIIYSCDGKQFSAITPFFNITYSISGFNCTQSAPKIIEFVRSDFKKTISSWKAEERLLLLIMTDFKVENPKRSLVGCFLIMKKQSWLTCHFNRTRRSRADFSAVILYALDQLD